MWTGEIQRGMLPIERHAMESGQTTAKNLTTEVVSSPDRFLALGEEWDALVESAGIAHPFVSHLWLRTWWESFAPQGAQLRILLVREDGRPVGGAPMFLCRRSIYGVPVRSLETLANDHSPRIELPVAAPPGSLRRAAIATRMWAEMAGTRCDLILFQQLLAESPTLEAMRGSAGEAGWHTGEWQASSAPYIPLPPEHEELMAGLKSKRRYNLRKRLEKLEELGPVELEIASSPEGLEEALDDAFRIEALGWKGRAGTAMASDRGVREFYTGIARRSVREGTFRLAFLLSSGRRIAFSYLLDHRRTVYGVKVGFDPELNHCGPGHTLLNMVLRDACERGFTEYDFLGDADHWKLSWTKETRPHRWLFAFRPGLRGRLLHTGKFVLLPRIKGLLASLRDRGKN